MFVTGLVELLVFLCFDEGCCLWDLRFSMVSMKITVPVYWTTGMVSHRIVIMISVVLGLILT